MRGVFSERPGAAAPGGGPDGRRPEEITAAKEAAERARGADIITAGPGAVMQRGVPSTIPSTPSTRGGGEGASGGGEEKEEEGGLHKPAVRGGAAAAHAAARGRACCRAPTRGRFRVAAAAGARVAVGSCTLGWRPPSKRRTTWEECASRQAATLRAPPGINDKGQPSSCAASTLPLPSPHERSDSPLPRQVTTWGVFPRPKNISEAYGGGRNIRPGQALESDEQKAKREVSVRACVGGARARTLIIVELGSVHSSCLPAPSDCFRVGHKAPVVRPLSPPLQAEFAAAMAKYKQAAGLTEIDPAVVERAGRRYRAGEELMAAGRLSEALAVFNEVRRRRPLARAGAGTGAGRAWRIGSAGSPRARRPGAPPEPGPPCSQHPPTLGHACTGEGLHSLTHPRTHSTHALTHSTTHSPTHPLIRRQVRDAVPLKTRVGGLATLQAAICLDTLGDGASAQVLYRRLRGHPSGEVGRRARHLVFGFQVRVGVRVCAFLCVLGRGGVNGSGHVGGPGLTSQQWPLPPPPFPRATRRPLLLADGTPPLNPTPPPPAGPRR